MQKKAVIGLSVIIDAENHKQLNNIVNNFVGQIRSLSMGKRIKIEKINTDVGKIKTLKKKGD